MECWVGWAVDLVVVAALAAAAAEALVSSSSRSRSSLEPLAGWLAGWPEEGWREQKSTLT